MARLFGYPLNVDEPEEEAGNGGGSSINAEEASRSATQPDGEAARESNPYPRAAPMDSESDLDNNSFIDFFGRESREIRTAGECDVMEVEDEEIELVLGIGAGSGSGQSGDGKETDSGRVEAGMDLAPFGDDDDLFCEEEAMLMADDVEVLAWESLQNDIAWEEEEADGEILLRTALSQNTENQFAIHVNDDAFVGDYNGEYLGGLLGEAFEGISQMDVDEFHGVMRSRPASKRAVDDLPVVEITSDGESSSVCSICIGEVVAGEKVTRLPCGHYFHGGCIVSWLGVKNTCPVCRYELPTDETTRRSQRL